MILHDRLPDEDLDALLERPRAHAGTSPVAALLSEVRDDAATTDALPSAKLEQALAEGFVTTAPAQGILTFSKDAGILTAPKGILTASTDSGILTRGILTMQTRGRLAGRVLVTKFAAVGMLGKAVAATAATAAVTVGAGATGALPAPAQVAFDEFAGRDEIPVVVERDEPQVDTVTVVELPGEASDVARDATGSTDGERGVDGREIAQEATEGRSGGTASQGAVEGQGRTGRNEDAAPVRGQGAEDEQHQGGDSRADDGQDARSQGDVDEEDAAENAGDVDQQGAVAEDEGADVEAGPADTSPSPTGDALRPGKDGGKKAAGTQQLLQPGVERPAGQPLGRGPKG